MQRHRRRIFIEWLVRGISLGILVLGVMGLIDRTQAANQPGPSEFKLYDDTLPLESPISYITSMPQLESRIRFDREVPSKGGQEISLQGSACRLKVNRVKAEDRKFELGSEYIVNKVVAKKESLVIRASNSLYQPGGFEIVCDGQKDWRQAKVGEVVKDLGSSFSITE